MTAPQEPPVTRVLGPAPRETIPSRIRRWGRSQLRHRGLRFWLFRYGLVVFPLFVVLFVVNGFVVGWKFAYNVGAQIDSPWDTSAPWLAVFLSLAGWLAIPALVGAVVGQVVVETTSNRRVRSQRPDGPGPHYIPLLNSLRYDGHRFSVRKGFPEEFVHFHAGNWNVAQSHWEIMVSYYLDTLATDARTYRTPKQAMIEAVNAAAAILPEPVEACPRCLRSTKAPKESGTGA